MFSRPTSSKHSIHHQLATTTHLPSAISSPFTNSDDNPKRYMAEYNVSTIHPILLQQETLSNYYGSLDQIVPQQSANKDALSRALGAVYLSHKVQQLEKTVNGSRREYGRDRDRGTSPTKELNRSSVNGRGPTRRGGPGNNAKARTQRGSGDMHIESEKSDADEKHKIEKHVKDADVVVVDASVLVHALGQLKAWCRKDRKEIVLVPLEGKLKMQ